MDSRMSIFSKIISEDLLTPEIGNVYIKTFEPGYRMEAHSHGEVKVISVLHSANFMVINNQYMKIKKNINLEDIEKELCEFGQQYLAYHLK